MPGTRDVGILVAITFLAILARIYRLDSGLWYDEVVTLVEFVRLPVSDIMTSYTSLNNHIFYSLQAHASLAIFGESAWALRLPAVLFGVAAIPLFWLMVLRTSGSVGAAHVAAGLLALNYHHIWFSQNARGYTGLVFWCILAMYLLIEARRSSRPALWVGIAIAGGLAMYTHLSAAFFLTGLSVAVLIVEALTPSQVSIVRRLTLPALALSGAAIVGLLLHAPVLNDLMHNVSRIAEPAASGATVDPFANWKNPLSALFTALAHLRLPLPTVVVMVGAPITAVVAIAGLVRLARWDALLAATIPATIVVTIAGLMFAGMRIWPRFFLTDLVLMLVVAMCSVSVISDFVARGRASQWLKIAGWSLGLVISAAWATKNYAAPKQDFVGAVRLVEAEMQTGDDAASFGLATWPLATFFAPEWVGVEDEVELVNLVRKPGRTYLLYAFPEQSRQEYPAMFELLDRDFEHFAYLPGTLGAGDIHVWREK